MGIMLVEIKNKHYYAVETNDLLRLLNNDRTQEKKNRHQV